MDLYLVFFLIAAFTSESAIRKTVAQLSATNQG